MLATLEAKLIAFVVSLGLLAAYGISAYEYGKIVQKNKAAIVAAVQTDRTKMADTKNQGDANVSENELISDLQAVHSYYHNHPVIRVRVVSSECTVPKAADNSKGTDGSTTSLHASPYSPESTELIAAQLNDLQKRLLAAGVIVK